MVMAASFKSRDKLLLGLVQFPHRHNGLPLAGVGGISAPLHAVSRRAPCWGSTRRTARPSSSGSALSGKPNSRPRRRRGPRKPCARPAARPVPSQKRGHRGKELAAFARFGQEGNDAPEAGLDA